MSVQALRFSIGDVTLTRISYAEVLVDAAVVGLTAPQVAAIEWASPIWADQDEVRVAAAAWIIESHGRRIVVDPLQAADAILRAGPDASFHQEAVADALATAGFARESIDSVVVSHIDGIGMIAWLTDGRWSPFFPNAEVVLSERELTAISANGDYQPDGSDALLALCALGVVTTVGDEHAVTEEVVTRWTGAHSPGHQVTDITSGDGTATMIGHLALSPLHLAVHDCELHGDPPAAEKALRDLRRDRQVLIGPLWPTPGAARLLDGQVCAAVPDAHR